MVDVFVARGYLAPEYAAFGQLSAKLDVFSYGILILEIISGRKNIDLNMPVEQQYLFDWVSFITTHFTNYSKKNRAFIITEMIIKHITLL